MPSVDRHKGEQARLLGFKGLWPALRFSLLLCSVLLTNNPLSVSSCHLLSFLSSHATSFAFPSICPHSPENGGFQQFSFLGSFPPPPPGSSGRHSSAISPPGGGCCSASMGEICWTRRVGLLDWEPGIEPGLVPSPLHKEVSHVSSSSLSAPLAVSRLNAFF